MTTLASRFKRSGVFALSALLIAMAGCTVGADAYKGGAISLVDVLVRDQQLLVSRDQLAQLHANDARAAVSTFRALGGGWPQSATGPVARQQISSTA